jgi:hypothetical protein
VRHEPRDAAISVIERMSPKEAMMRRRDCYDLAAKLCSFTVELSLLLKVSFQ